MSFYSITEIWWKVNNQRPDVSSLFMDITVNYFWNKIIHIKQWCVECAVCRVCCVLCVVCAVCYECCVLWEGCAVCVVCTVCCEWCVLCVLCAVSGVCAVYCVFVCCEWCVRCVCCVLWVVCAVCVVSGVSGVCCVYCVLCVMCVRVYVCTCVDRGWTVSGLTFHNKTALSASAGTALELSYTVTIFKRYSFVSCSYITCSHKLFSSDNIANNTKLTAVRGSCPEARHSCPPSPSFLSGAVQNTWSSNYDFTSPINNDTSLQFRRRYTFKDDRGATVCLTLLIDYKSCRKYSEVSQWAGRTWRCSSFMFQSEQLTLLFTPHQLCQKMFCLSFSLQQSHSTKTMTTMMMMMMTLSSSVPSPVSWAPMLPPVVCCEHYTSGTIRVHHRAWHLYHPNHHEGCLSDLVVWTFRILLLLIVVTIAALYLRLFLNL